MFVIERNQIFFQRNAFQVTVLVFECTVSTLELDTSAFRRQLHVLLCGQASFDEIRECFVRKRYNIE